jgi:hypothetical protein
MAGRVRVQPASRVGLAPLVDMAEHLRVSLGGWEDASRSTVRPHVTSDIALDLAHLAHHDGDGFLTASLGDDVVGFSTSYVRSRQFVLAHLWLLPEVAPQEAAEALLRRSLAFGERAGVADWGAHVLGGAAVQGLCFRFGLRPRFPVYRLTMAYDEARRLGLELAKLLPGRELTEELLNRHAGSADLERLDRLVRGIARPMDHEYWLTGRRLRVAAVREGKRIAGYGYGGAGQCGPVAAATGDAALAALGWALQFAAAANPSAVEVMVPAPFESALEQLLDAGAACRAATLWMTRQPANGMERYILPGANLV